MPKPKKSAPPSHRVTAAATHNDLSTMYKLPIGKPKAQAPKSAKASRAAKRRAVAVEIDHMKMACESGITMRGTKRRLQEK